MLPCKLGMFVVRITTSKRKETFMSQKVVQRETDLLHVDVVIGASVKTISQLKSRHLLRDTLWKIVAHVTWP